MELLWYLVHLRFLPLVFSWNFRIRDLTTKGCLDIKKLLYWFCLRELRVDKFCKCSFYVFWYTVYEITTSSQFLISNVGPFGGDNPFSRKNSSLLILFLDEINSVDVQANNLQRHALIKEGSRVSAENNPKEPSLSPALPCTSFMYPFLSHSVPLMQVKNGNSDRKLQSYKLYAIHVLK